jgi:hypothetical protein
MHNTEHTMTLMKSCCERVDSIFKYYETLPFENIKKTCFREYKRLKNKMSDEEFYDGLLMLLNKQTSRRIEIRNGEFVNVNKID